MLNLKTRSNEAKPARRTHDTCSTHLQHALYTRVDVSRVVDRLVVESLAPELLQWYRVSLLDVREPTSPQHVVGDLKHRARRVVS